MLQLIFPHRERSKHTDSLDWSRKYEVLSLSRLYLSSLGYTTEQIQALSDEDMQRIADTINNRSFLYFEEDVKFAVWEELKDKGLDNQTTGEGSPGEILEEQEQDRETRQT